MTDSPDSQECLRRLAEALTADESALDPGYLGLLIAARYYPNLDVAAYVARLDALATKAKAHLGRGRAPARVIAAINKTLFEEEGFFGNVEDYYDPRNSFLNEVLDRKTGIPITLSIVYLSVARRLNQPIVGVGLPLHFIVKYVDAEGDIYIDPFHGGQILTMAGCRERVERAYGAPVHFREAYLEAVPTRLILYRMLNNLKYLYLRHQDYPRAGMVIEQMLVVQPDQIQEVRDRGLALLEEGLWSQAVTYLARYLRENPDASDAELVRRKIQSAYENLARRN